MSHTQFHLIGRIAKLARLYRRRGLDAPAQTLEAHARKARRFFETNQLDYSPTLRCVWPTEIERR